MFQQCLITLFKKAKKFVESLPSQARIQGVFLGVRNPPPPTAVCNILFIFKPTDVNFPLPFKFHCRIQSTYLAFLSVIKHTQLPLTEEL